MARTKICSQRTDGTGNSTTNSTTSNVINSSIPEKTSPRIRSAQSPLHACRICSLTKLCTKNRVEMEVFPLRPSAYLCVLCVNGAFQRREGRDTQRPQRKQIRFAIFVQSRLTTPKKCPLRTT